MVDVDCCPICVKRPLDEQLETSRISWLQCSQCYQWFHVDCLEISVSEVENLHSYHCRACSQKYGPSIHKRRLKRAKVQIDYIALNEGDTFAVSKSFHPHVQKFLDFEVDANANGNSESKKREMWVDVVDNLTKEYALSTGLAKPVLVVKADDRVLGMNFPRPRSDITIDYIAAKVGEETNLEVMDVLTQQGVSPSWTLGEWKEYFHLEEGNRDRIRNVISLEISDVDELGEAFVRPKMVRDLDLVDKVWSDTKERPKVTKYCLMSVEGSFTDFHIDFSGTAVYYTVCSGSKEFLMYPPTDHNLDLYKSWCLLQDQNYRWFGDMSKNNRGKIIVPSGGFKVTLNPGDVFIIPSGWIHAVYTPKDSIVIGGNFLTLMDIIVHLKINAIERETKVPTKFRFPKFNKVLWLTSWYYFNHKEEFLQDLTGHSTGVKSEKKEGDEPATGTSLNSPYKTLEAIIAGLKFHHTASLTSKVAKDSIPVNKIGRDVPEYIKKLEQWLEELKSYS